MNRNNLKSSALKSVENAAKIPNKHRERESQRDGGKLSCTCLPYNGNYNKQQQASILSNGTRIIKNPQYI